MVAVSGNTVNLKATPSPDGAVTATVAKGTLATLIAVQSGWVQIRLDNGASGWLSDWLIDTTPTVTRPKANASGAAQLSGGPEVIGYYTVNFPGDTSSYKSLVSNGSNLTGIAPFLFTIDPSGKVTGNHNSEAMAAAKSRGIKTFALVHNLAGPWFNGSLAKSVLGNPLNRQRAVYNIANIVRTYGYTGVNIDFESVPASMRQALTSFVSELAGALRPEGHLVTISVPAKTRDSWTDDWSGAYDYQALAKYADMIMLMTYDQNFRSGPPGPIASIGWVEDVVQFAVSQAPANKFLLGLAAYGYDWPSYGDANAISVGQAMDIARRNGRTVQWSDRDKSPYFTYYKSGVKRTVWFESGNSYRYKLDLVKRYGLKGVALWRLGFEDSTMWSTINQYLL
jgi:spore germination protein YaaH